MLEQHLEKLRSFYVTAQQNNLLKASHILHISQPAVGKNIKILEEILDVQLLLRHRRGVTLTKAGTELFQFCDSLFLKIKDVEARVHSNDTIAGVIKIGTYETLGEIFWPKVLSVLQRKYPDLSVELISQETNLWERLEAGGLDMIVDSEPQTSDQYHSEVLYYDRFGIFSAAKTQFSVEDASIPFSFVKHANDRNGEFVDAHLRKLKIPFALRYDVGTFTMTKAFVKSDLCVGVLPLSLAEDAKLKAFLWKGKPQYFGEHRICATMHDSMKSESRLKEVTKTLKEVMKTEIS